ncbi:MAG: hypothetical protein AUJ47_07785 [Candidatus Marinimicrobia bacterium CG1_02_48_14]|nr:MAG: hypothetical protein AUJ47_07785 [Candidatus Marinimicrobia bacterium CG1_02_48_14]PJA54970.1 MAG: hypothetical protein CO167_00775 [Candidatus Marinimicrobia bacterium CG_4_9_14_3_um_filter_48_9]
MSFDLSQILQDWPYDQRRLTARKFLGDDGILKIQMRVDLGILQMNYEGRPDGTKPKKSTSWLDYFRKILKREKMLVLADEDVQQLRMEAIQYYHRYLSLYQLKDFPGVIRDTRHNLEIMKMIAQYGSEEDLFSVQQYRPHVLMMHSSAKAELQLGRNQRKAALATVHQGIKQIKRFYGDVFDLDQPEASPEIMALRELQHRITDDSIPDPPEKQVDLEENLELAVYSENFELAARLRDELNQLKDH